MYYFYNQLAEAGISAKRYLSEGLGYGSDDAGMAKLSSDLQAGAIGSNKALELITQGMKEYSGMMVKTGRETVSGLKSNIGDTFEISIFRKWGMGLQEGAKRGLGAFADFLDANNDRLDAMGDKLQGVARTLSNNLADAAEYSMSKILEVTDSEAFDSASIGGKIKIVWDAVIGEPLSKWWNSTGQKYVQGIAGDVGHGIGSFITGAVKGIFGIELTGEAAKGGLSVGKAFADGFLDGFNLKEIGNAIAKGIGAAFVNASKLFPGGEKGDTRSVVSAALLAFGAKKMGAGKLISKMFSKGSKGAVGAAESIAGGSGDAGAYASWWKKANLFNITGREAAIAAHDAETATKATGKLSELFKFMHTGLIKDAAAVMPKANKVLGSLKGFAKGNWLSLLFAGSAIAQSDDKVGETVTQGGSMVGGIAGAKAGAAIGTALAPGIGTAIGTALGSIGGYIGGEKLMDAVFGDINATEYVKGLLDGTAALEKSRVKLEEQRKETSQISANYKQINDDLWAYNDLSKKLNDANTPLEERQRIQENINGLVKELHDYYPNLISQYDVENGKLSANYATLHDIAQLDKERAGYELRTEIADQEKNFEKEDVAKKLEESNGKINEGKKMVNKFDEALPSLYSYNAEVEKLIALNKKAHEEENWLDVNKYNNEISQKMEEVNAIMDSLGMAPYKFNGEGFVDGGLDRVLDQQQKFIDIVTEEYETNDALRSTYDELFLSKKALIELDLGGTIEDEASKYQTMNETQKAAFDDALANVIELQDEMMQLTSKDYRVNIKVVRENMGTGSNNPAGGKDSDGTPYSYEKHAEGGILDRPHLGLVAEDGAEAIIPLSSKRRERGIALWQKAGRALGIPAHAEGGIFGKTARPTAFSMASNAMLAKNASIKAPIAVEKKAATNAGTAAGVAASVWDRAEDVAKLGKSSQVLYRGYLRDNIEKYVPYALRKMAQKSAKGTVAAIYNSTRMIESVSRKIPLLGSLLQVGGVALDTYTADGDKKLQTLISGLGGFGGQVLGGMATGGALGALGLNPVTVAMGAIAGGIGGAVFGEKFTDWAYNKIFDRNSAAGTLDASKLQRMTNDVRRNKNIADAVKDINDRSYTTAKGDSLYAIASELLGDGSRYPEIAAINGITNARMIPVGKTLNIPKHADGGIFNKPHLGMVAEAGAEAVIPLDNRNSSALGLWQEAGRKIGAPVSYLNRRGNGTEMSYSASNASSGTGGIKIDMGGFHFKIDVNGATDANAVVAAIRAEMPAITNEMCRLIVDTIRKHRSNYTAVGV